ncbi:MAG: hypothetical protein WA116_03900 [Anaerolineaceae bacterium]
MEFEKSVDSLSKKEKRKILLSGGIVFDVIGGLLLLMGLAALAGGSGSSCLVLIIPAFLLIFFGVKKLFWKEEKKRDYIVSKLYKQASKAQKKSGVNISKEENDRMRFENDPLFHEKIMNNVHKDDDAKYDARIRQVEAKRQKLQKGRVSEIQRISNARWESVCGGKLMYNITEGKVRINQSETVFSSIQGAELNIENSYRIVTHESGKAKKHASLGGAVAGGLLLGPVGAVAGGIGLGKTKTNSTSTSNPIPTCNHLGVMVNINGFMSEILLISGTVDQSSSQYANAQRNAQEIITKLRLLAQTPVPEIFLKAEEEPSVLNFDRQITEVDNELEIAKADTPKYEIPEKYRPIPKAKNIEQ